MTTNTTVIVVEIKVNTSCYSFHRLCCQLLPKPTPFFTSATTLFSFSLVLMPSKQPRPLHAPVSHYVVDPAPLSVVVLSTTVLAVSLVVTFSSATMTLSAARLPQPYTTPHRPTPRLLPLWCLLDVEPLSYWPRQPKWPRPPSAPAAPPQCFSGIVACNGVLA